VHPSNARSIWLLASDLHPTRIRPWCNSVPYALLTHRFIVLEDALAQLEDASGVYGAALNRHKKGLLRVVIFLCGQNVSPFLTLPPAWSVSHVHECEARTPRQEGPHIQEVDASG
jgi:hypothetical protein